MSIGIGELLIILVICAGPVLLGAVLAVLLVLRNRKKADGNEPDAQR